MIAYIENSGMGHLVFNVLLAMLYVALFALSVVLAVRRREPGFRVLPIATGLWLVNTGITWTDSPELMHLTFYIFPLGLTTFVVALALMVRPKH